MSVSQSIQIRWIIWREVLNLLKKIENNQGICFRTGKTQGSSSYQGIAIPDKETWQLAEALCIAVSVTKSKGTTAGTRVDDIFGKFGPIRFDDWEGTHYLWSQTSVKGKNSELGCRPDLTVTTSPETPSPDNIMRVIECKAADNLETRVIRQEFGKAFDLKINSYLIWSLWKPQLRIVEGANRLGLDVSSFEFDTERINDFVGVPGSLVEYVWQKIDESWRARHFLEMIDRYIESHRNKWLGR